MIDTLGLPLAEAKRRLADAGFLVSIEEARSRKGVDGADARVLRQTEESDGTIGLTYAYCVTTPKE